MKILITLISLLISGLVQASCWEEIYSDQRTDIYIDACSITQSGAQKKAWFRHVYAATEKLDYYPHKEYDEIKFLTYFNCASRTSANVQIINYGPEPDNEVVSTWSVNPKLASYNEVVPDTFGEIQLEAACKKNGK